MHAEALNWPLTPPLTLNPPPNIPAVGAVNNGIVSPGSCAPAVHSPPKNLSRFSSSSSLPGLVHTSPHRRGSMAGERSLSTSRGPSPEERRNSKVKGQARIAKKPSRQYLRNKKSLISMAHEDLKSPPPSSDTASFSSAGTKSLTSSSTPLNRQPRHFRSMGQFVPHARPAPSNMQTAAAATALYPANEEMLDASFQSESQGLNMTPVRSHTSQNSGNQGSMAPPPSLTPNAMAAAAAAAAANHAGPTSTPVRREPAYGSPSTIVVNGNSTIQRTKSSRPLVQPSPTPAVRLHSSTQLVAAASDSSPAKGMFVQEKKKGAPPKKATKTSKAIPEMSSAMSQFQVQLNTHAHPKPKASTNSLKSSQDRITHSSQPNPHLSNSAHRSHRSLAASAAAAAAQPPPNMQPYYLNPGQEYGPKGGQQRQQMLNRSPAGNRYGLGLTMDGRPAQPNYVRNEYVDFMPGRHPMPPKPHFAAQAGAVALNGPNRNVPPQYPAHQVPPQHRPPPPPQPEQRQQPLQPPPMMHDVLGGGDDPSRMNFGVPPSWSPQSRGAPPPLSSPGNSRSESLQSRVSMTSIEEPSWTVFSPSHFSGSIYEKAPSKSNLGGPSSADSLPQVPSHLSDETPSVTQLEGTPRSQQTVVGLEEFNMDWDNGADEESGWDVMDLLKPEFAFD